MSKILIIEDEEAIADLEKDYLELSGFTVEIEERGDTGLTRALAEDFDLIILDLMLPGMDGFEICRQIRQEKNIPVEIITNDVASGANPWGCTDYLNQQKNIRKTGVKVYEFMGKHSCHTKAVLLDDRMSILGSYNLDMRSTYQDTELMLAVDAPALNSMIRKEVETDKTYSKIMQENGEYQYGENYKAKEMTTGKKVFYGVLRVVILPLRRFL